uniref:Uncharacterized protein n=1 Tax=Myoviridae sp. ctplG2 TaxID=2826700 RepID=A0A8S5LW32_9CAUD|nr:MAG TPA: hypothetical protein [Myoviridae sp. ctplG2]DAT31417.1 MAG TPA: hypothetical protein [Caudoviricetes sp.]
MIFSYNTYSPPCNFSENITTFIDLLLKIFYNSINNNYINTIQNKHILFLRFFQNI